MTDNASSARRRGRPPRSERAPAEPRAALLHAGVAAMTEFGFTASGLDTVLRAAGVPKGSFYYYFDSKDAFALAVIAEYGAYFQRRLQRTLGNAALPPLQRIEAFCANAREGLLRHDYRRGCLVGQLGQEIANLSEPVRVALTDLLHDWEAAMAACLDAARQAGELPATLDVAASAEHFWTGWEGAILRARLERSTRPLEHFEARFLAALRCGA
jgi:TetR/AcrR family transcriptional repressor of nem operon